jgi:hypothetical protein
MVARARQLFEGLRMNNPKDAWDILLKRTQKGSAMRLPIGWHSLTPRIVTDDVAGLVEFLRLAFGATGEVHADRPTVMRIGDSISTTPTPPTSGHWKRARGRSKNRSRRRTAIAAEW